MPEHPAFADFAAAVERRLEKGREVYADRSFDRDPAEHAGFVRCASLPSR